MMKEVSVTRLHELQGSAYEDVYLEEVGNFKDATSGVDGDDIAAALILRDEGRLDLLERLHRRELHTVVSVDEDTRFEDLEFE
jgi:hypothetical protein